MNVKVFKHPTSLHAMIDLKINEDKTSDQNSFEITSLTVK